MIEDIKKTLWATADKLRANMDAAEYKHIVLGLIFVKYISDKIACAVAAWRGEVNSGEYRDVPGFCRSVALTEIAEHGHVLTPGRYVGAEAVENDDEGFAAKMQKLSETLGEQVAKGAELDKMIHQNLEGLGFYG